jgi:hypothetical protein
VSINRPEWHVAEADLAGYAAGTVATVPSASIEAHLLVCGRCRGVLSHVTAAERDLAWERLSDTIDRSSSTLVERLARQHGLARSAVATPLMLRAAMGAVTMIVLLPLVTAVVAGRASTLAVLLLAPLARLVAVALSYRQGADPAGEITLATPTAGLRLVAMRAMLVAAVGLVVSVGMLLLADTWFDVPTGLAYAWCLPGLALAALVLLAGTTRLNPLSVAAGLSLAWVAVLMTTATAHRSIRYELLLQVIGSPAAQLLALGVTVAALALAVARRDNVAYRRFT